MILEKGGFTLHKGHSSIKSKETQDNCLIEEDEQPTDTKQSTSTSNNKTKILELAGNKETNEVSIDFTKKHRKEQEKTINDCSD